MHKPHKPLSEKSLQKQIVKYLASVSSCWAIKVIVANERGCPDILCCINGKFLGMEVKAETGHPSAIQLAQHQRIWKAGGKAYVVQSVDEARHIVASLSPGV